MLTRSLLRTGLRDLRRRPLHTGLMILGVALGVAVVVAIDLANGSARRAFALSTEAVVGRATHQVLGGPSGLPEELFRRLRLEGLRRSAPVFEGVAVALVPDHPGPDRNRGRGGTAIARRSRGDGRGRGPAALRRGGASLPDRPDPRGE